MIDSPLFLIPLFGGIWLFVCFVSAYASGWKKLERTYSASGYSKLEKMRAQNSSHILKMGKVSVHTMPTKAIVLKNHLYLEPSFSSKIFRHPLCIPFSQVSIEMLESTLWWGNVYLLNVKGVKIWVSKETYNLLTEPGGLVSKIL